MKIITNVQKSGSGGIYHAFTSFLGYLNQTNQKKIKITGIDVQHKDNSHTQAYQNKEGIFTLNSTFCDFPGIEKAARIADSLKDMENLYEEVIEQYRQLIKLEKPDVILLNGTYYLPWCLLMASKSLRIPTILHYHGILSKEITSWEDKSRKLLEGMEKSFNLPQTFYIFPSKLAKKVVEEEVFGNKVKRFTISPNPVPRHFFTKRKKKKNNNLGIVSRWANVKNSSYAVELGAHNSRQNNKLSINVVTDLNEKSKGYEKLSELVNFKKIMSSQKLAGFYSRMGVVISPSFFETYGNVAQEALASNTPALVNSQMGVAETYKKLGLKDWVVDFNLVGEVFKKAKELIDQEVPLKIRKTLYEEYSPEITSLRMLNAIKSV